MALMAREWLLLPKEEQEKRKRELSKEECYKLRMELSTISFSEEEKSMMSEEEKKRFVHPHHNSVKEKEDYNKKAKVIFEQMQMQSK